MRIFHYDFQHFGSDPRYVRWTGRVVSQPSWVWQIAMLAAFLVIFIPIAAVVFSAVGIFLIVFLVLAMLNWAIQSVRGLFGPRDGRRNVRIVRAER
jgi:hypothetical protein